MDRRCHQQDFKKGFYRTSLVVQWFKICPPVQGTWVRSLVHEDPTCCQATEPHAPWLLSLCSGACAAAEAPSMRSRAPPRKVAPHLLTN